MQCKQCKTLSRNLANMREKLESKQEDQPSIKELEEGYKKRIRDLKYQIEGCHAENRVYYKKILAQQGRIERLERALKQWD